VSRLTSDDDEVIDRDTLTAGLGYKRDSTKVTSKIEYRKDKSESRSSEQWVLVNNLEYRRSEALRWQGRFNYSSTEGEMDAEDAEFMEAGIGFAYRPVANDRLNMLGRYTSLLDLPPQSQSEETDRRYSIFSLENSYDLSAKFSVGSKLAFRKGEQRLQRGRGPWLNNDATLASARLRYKAQAGMNAMASYQWLGSDATDSVRQGALLSVGYNVHEYLQMSLGYNFTDFNDNLADDDYDVSGWFLNFVGKY